MGERLHGMQEVEGSIPSGSTNFPNIFRHMLEWVTRQPVTSWMRCHRFASSLGSPSGHPVFPESIIDFEK